MDDIYRVFLQQVHDCNLREDYPDFGDGGP